MSVGKLGAGRVEYYLSQVASGVEDYYLGSGEATGVWLGAGAGALGLSGEVGGDDLRAVLRGVAPSGVTLAGPGRRTPGFDLTVSAPKSVSILYALGDRQVASEVLAGHEEAVRQAMAYLEREACFTRRGHAGSQVVRGAGFVGAEFRHRTSRDGDPQLHTHALVANAVQGADGRWSTLDARFLFAHARTAGFLYQAALRDELTRRLGVAWGPVKRGMADVDGFDRGVLAEFSGRRRTIVATLRERGERSARAAQVATLDTRAPKGADRRSYSELRDDWLARAGRLGVTPRSLGKLTGRVRWQSRPAPAVTREALVSPLGLTSDRSSFDRRDVIAAYCDALAAGARVVDVEALADRLLAHEQVHPLALSGLDAKLQRFQRGDGRVMPSPNGRRYTTIEMAAVEKHLVDSSAARAEDGVAVAPAEAVDAAIAMNRRLSEEQQAMVRRLTTSGAGVEVVIGKAGAGKTMALDVARLVWQATGTPVVGCALAARAAEELRATAGIPSATISRLARELEVHALPRGSVIVVDEAAMVGTRTLDWLAHAAEQRGAKLVLVGDPRQLPAIAAGGGFAALTDALPAVDLRVNRRQTERWERAALDDLAAGKAGAAMVSYRRHGRVTVAPTADMVRDVLVADWAAARASGSNARMLALHRSDVADLNLRARELLRSAGVVSGRDVEAGGRRFAAGDWVVGRRNDYRAGFLNGTLGTVVAVQHEARTVTVQTPGGERIGLSRSYLAGGHLDHAYAVTVHKAQGATFDEAFVLGDDRLYREAGYVAMSRGRSSNRLYVVDSGVDPGDEHRTLERADGVDRLNAALSRSHAEAPVSDRVLAPAGGTAIDVDV